MQHCIVIKNLSDIDRAAKEFLSIVGNGRIIAFYAPMGAGKTTFTTAICRALGVTLNDLFWEEDDDGHDHE